MTDLEDIEAAISDEADRVIAAINARPNYWTTLFWIAVGWILVSWVPDVVWYSKARYSFQYSTDFAKISISKSPHDCGFFTAPLGDKFCHYEREVSTVRWATSTTGLPIVSYDEGKTWITFTPDDPKAVPKTSTIVQVTISWVKKDD
jgi:hypothetical protein